MIGSKLSSTMRRLRCVSWALGLWCLAVLPGFAAASLSGSLLDPGGGVVPGATIRLVRLADSSRGHQRARQGICRARHRPLN